MLADVRVRIYRKLERLAPAGLAAFRSGDMLTRLISDVDATQDLFIRGITPPLTAVLVGAGVTTAMLVILAPAAGVLAAGLLGGAVRYSPDAPLAVRNIDLDLEPGRRVALVGSTGAGKSTIAAVLFRFADLSAGTALPNGRDLAGYRSDDVRAVISGCAADPHIFDATIRDNLRLARPQTSDAELAAAAAKARLLDWITGLPLGWDTPVGTHGAALSGGQRQRLAPALLAGRATLLITHDLAGLDQVDEIVVLGHGQVAERGTHAELIEAGGTYQRLWEASR